MSREDLRILLDRARMIEVIIYMLSLVNQRMAELIKLLTLSW